MYKCTEINDDERQIIFNWYWKELNHNRKRDYLLSCMEIKKSERKYVKQEHSNCSYVYKYFMCVKDVQKTVCRKFILSTLDISEKLLRYTRDNRLDLFSSKSDERGKKTRQNKTPNEIMKHIDEYRDATSCAFSLLSKFQ